MEITSFVTAFAAAIVALLVGGNLLMYARGRRKRKR